MSARVWSSPQRGGGPGGHVSGRDGPAACRREPIVGQEGGLGKGPMNNSQADRWMGPQSTTCSWAEQKQTLDRASGMDAEGEEERLWV